MGYSKNFFTGTFLALVLSVMNWSTAAADAVADFYRGKTITYVVSAGPGGMYGLYGRTFTQHLSKHLPGNPEIIVQYMPGSGGFKAANYLYNVAPKDGTYIAMLLKDLPVAQLLEPKGARFDMSKVNWIGNITDVPNVLAMYHKAPATTLEGIRKTEVFMGTTGKQDPEMALNLILLNKFTGTRFKLISGYRGVSDIDKALEAGELHGRGGSLASWLTRKPEWVKEGKVKFLVQIGLSKTPKLPESVPLLSDLGTTDEEKAILKFMSAAVRIGRSVFTMQNVPEDRVAALRKAFDMTMNDPAFLAEAKKRALDINPMSGIELQKVIKDVVETPKPMVNKIRAALGKT